MMPYKEEVQYSLADGLVWNGRGLNSFLEKVSSKLEWSIFEKILGATFKQKMGRKSYHPLLLFKCLLLEKWYNLSDPGLEESLSDRLSFKKFVGLSLSSEVPDHSTFSRFREKLSKKEYEGKKLLEILWDELQRQLIAQGVIVKSGTIVDATLVPSAARKPSADKNNKIGRSDYDKDAQWVCYRKHLLYGYKGHIGIDEGSEMIVKQHFTAANTLEVHTLEEVIQGDESWVFADKGYCSKNNSALLKAKGIKDGIMRKGARYVKLDKNQELRNALIKKRRYAVEHVFGTMKRSYGYTRVKYNTIVKNSLEFMVICFAFNLKKLNVLT